MCVCLAKHSLYYGGKLIWDCLEWAYKIMWPVIPRQSTTESVYFEFLELLLIDTEDQSSHRDNVKYEDSDL